MTRAAAPKPASARVLLFADFGNGPGLPGRILDSGSNEVTP